MTADTCCRRRTPIVLLPFVVLWRLVTLVANLMGIILTLILGVLFMMIGLAFIGTFFGAIIGIPLFILGFFLLLRGLY